MHRRPRPDAPAARGDGLAPERRDPGWRTIPAARPEPHHRAVRPAAHRGGGWCRQARRACASGSAARCGPLLQRTRCWRDPQPALERRALGAHGRGVERRGGAGRIVGPPRDLRLRRFAHDSPSLGGASIRRVRVPQLPRRAPHGASGATHRPRRLFRSGLPPRCPEHAVECRRCLPERRGPPGPRGRGRARYRRHADAQPPPASAPATPGATPCAPASAG